MLGIFALSLTQARAKDAPMGVRRSLETTLGEPPRKTGVHRAFCMGPKRGLRAAQTKDEPSGHLTLENADACLKISRAESASSSPRS